MLASLALHSTTLVRRAPNLSGHGSVVDECTGVRLIEWSE